MADLTNAHAAAHDENASRTMKAWRDAEGFDAVRDAQDAWSDLPSFQFHAVISLSGGGKVHRVSAPSAKFLEQPWCGSSRWDGGRARVTDAPVTCAKCLKQMAATARRAARRS
jgi:hypothetical protein